MITIKKLAEVFQNDLNALLYSALGNDELQFRIWATAGEYEPPERDGNVITHYIIGNLRTSTSANDANNVLTMGVNGLSLDFMIPVYPPRTNAKQTSEQLAYIKDSQYPFIDFIAGIIDAAFKNAKATTMKDAAGVEYSIAYQAGMATSADIDLVPKFGNAVPFNVFIQVYFIEGGTNSKDVEVSVDGQLMPFQSVRFGRAAVIERDVYAGENVSKCFASSTAFSVDADFPSSTNSPATTTAIEYLITGEPNVGHFVNVKWGGIIEKLFFMSYNTVQATAAGISVAGISASFVELGGNDEVYGLPAGARTVRFTFNSSQEQQLAFTLSEECNTFIAGVGAAKRDGAQTVMLQSNSYEYDPENDIYTVNMVVDKQVTVTDASAPFTVV